jgi:hypothetical protein
VVLCTRGSYGNSSTRKAKQRLAHAASAPRGRNEAVSGLETASGEPPQTQGDTVLYCPLRGERPQSEGEEKDAANGSAKAAATGETDRVYLEVAPDGDLTRVLFRERGGVEVEFKFAEWEFNPVLPETFFRFTVPLGVAIVNGDSLAGSMP